MKNEKKNRDIKIYRRGPKSSWLDPQLYIWSPKHPKNDPLAQSKNTPWVPSVWAKEQKTKIKIYHKESEVQRFKDRFKEAKQYQDIRIHSAH